MRRSTIAVSLLFGSTCAGPQSTLAPAGKAAEQLADLFWWMVGGALLIWVFVVGLAVYAIVVRPQEHEHRKAKLLIIGGGVVFPTVVLALLLAYGLALLPGLLEPVPEGSLRIAVSGEQWWWRIRYLAADGTELELANEIHLPVGEPVEILLESPDVIHSFWIPSLGGKVDMIPGRRNRLRLDPTKTGHYRGVCAEYCGTSHAKMMFDVFVHPEEDFLAWLGRQSKPASAPAAAMGRAGERVFVESGCGACHTIRGTEADGRVGPDLTHVGSRMSIGAGILTNRSSTFAHWIARTDQVKPGVHMPAFDMLSDEELVAVATYLEGLE